MGYISFLPSLNERPERMDRLGRLCVFFFLFSCAWNHACSGFKSNRMEALFAPNDRIIFYAKLSHCSIPKTVICGSLWSRRVYSSDLMQPRPDHRLCATVAQGGFNRGDNYHVKIFLWGIPNCKQRAANEWFSICQIEDNMDRSIILIVC